MRQKLRQAQPGQSIVVVALFAILLFLAIGLTIDGGMVYVQRRLMQNTADAACLGAANQIALGKTITDATTRAQEVISQNLGPTGPGTGINAPGTLSYTSISDVYSPNAGAGVGLTRGIEISNADIRIALQSPATTFFMRVIGIGQYSVSARAHCNSVAGGGVSPFAVVRWRGFDKPNSTSINDLVSGSPNTDLTLPQTYRKGSEDKPMTVRDILRTEASSAIDSENWPGWGSADYPGDPTVPSGLYMSPLAGVRAGKGSDGENAPGFETTIAGNDANSNIPTNTSFSGPIILDYRQTTFPTPLFYNGLEPTTALNQYKDLVGAYLLGVYPGPHVIPGQQIAYYSGVSAGLVEKPFDLRYNVGDEVVALIFNGRIYDTGQSFTLTYPTTADSTVTRPRDSYSASCLEPGFDPNRFDGLATDPETRKDPASYRLTIQPDVFSLLRISTMLSDNPASWGNLEADWNSTGWNNLQISGSGPVFSISPTGQTLSLDVQPTDTFECTTVTVEGTETVTETLELPMRVNGAQTLYIEGRAESTGRRRATYALLNMNADSNDFYLYVPGELTFLPREPGQNDSAEIILQRAGDNTELDVSSPDVTVGTIEWFAPGALGTTLASGSTYNGVTASVIRQGTRNELNISVGTTATTGREYYLRIPVSYSGFTHYLWYYVAVRTELNNSQSINQYLYALGYAKFRITAITSNNIRGRAISGLLRPEEITSGLQPRLQAWDTSTP